MTTRLKQLARAAHAVADYVDAIGDWLDVHAMTAGELCDELRRGRKPWDRPMVEVPRG